MTEETQAALRRALRRLETADRYESEVRFALSGYSDAVVEEVVAILKAKRMIDDARTASYAVESNTGRRAVGAARFKERLERRGTPQGLVDEAVAAVSEGDGARAVALLATRFPAREAKDRGRAGRFLSGRGFDEEVVEAALNHQFGEAE